MTRITGRWTEDKVDALRELWATDLLAKHIGAQLGFTARAVRAKAQGLGLKKRKGGGARPRPVVTVRPVVAFRLPGPISSTTACLAFLTPPAPKPVGPLRGRILAQLARGPADTLDLSGACEAKELLVTQALTLLESEGKVVQSPSSGLRSRSWSLAMQEAA